MLVESAMQGALGGFADPARQMNVCRVDDNPLCILLDTDDAVERMLALFGFLLVTRQANDFLGLLRCKVAVELHDASGNLSLIRRHAEQSASRPSSGRFAHCQRPLW
jgi:hypothetical protein